MRTRTQQIPEEKSSVSLVAVPSPSVSGQGILMGSRVKTPEDQLRAIIDTIPALAWSAHPDGSAEFFNRRDPALNYGLRAAWSQPLLSKNKEVLGTFGMHYTEARTPSETDLRLIEGAGHIVVIAIEGERSQAALTKAFDEISKP